MPRPDKTLWTASEVADATRKYESAVAEVERLQQVVATAKTQLAAAVTDPARAAAAQQLQTAEEDLAEAQDIAEAARRRLADYLPNAPESRPASWQTSLVQYAVFGALALIVLASLMYGLFSNSLLPSLGNISTARGLITFLIAVVTVTIALILTLSTVVSESEDRAKRFLQGKELLTALIGVLGTIVGFYFGHSLDVPTQDLAIAPVYISSDDLKPGDKLSLLTFVTGGKPPYTYDVTFSSPVLAGATQVKTAEGLIRLESQVADVKDPAAVGYTIDVSDSEGRTVQYDSQAHGRQLQVKPASGR